MGDSPEAFAPFDPELLVSTYTREGALVFSNTAWQTVFGPGDQPWSRLAPEDREPAAQCIREAARGILVTNQIFSVVLADRDEPVPVLLHFLPVHLPTQGVPAPGAVMATGEVLAEPSSWTASQTLRHRLETLGRMAMGIAHDFNNLLSGILGYTELLKTYTVGEPLPSSFSGHLSTIEKAALDGAALVRKIQQYLRQEKETRFEPVDLPGLIQDCILFTRPYWYNEPRRQGITIQLNLDLQEVPPVLGSATELREIFVNLILNAVQAMPEGGELAIRTAFRSESGVQVIVRDTGLGMSEAVRTRIFEPMFTTKGEHGTGMGLSVSYGIVQEHDGKIHVASKLGEGTRFTLTFPPVQAASPQPASIAPEPASTSARVLLVDDEPMVRSVLSKLLNLRGHHVETAPSGTAALERIDETTYDIIFVDQAMPGMNGRELAGILRDRFPDLPIVLLTGDTEVGEPDDIIDVILGKPFQIDEVEATIQQLTSEGRGKGEERRGKGEEGKAL